MKFGKQLMLKLSISNSTFQKLASQEVVIYSYQECSCGEDVEEKEPVHGDNEYFREIRKQVHV
jgi:hypothetical protein